MKNYMVIVLIDGKQSAKFFDHLMDADQYRMNAECGCGGYAQVYKYSTGKHGGKYVLYYE